MATVSRQTLRTGIGREQAWMLYTPVATEATSGTTTSAGSADGSTIVDTGTYSIAIDQLVRKRTVVVITSGASRGERSYADGPPSTSGAITVSPAFSAQIASGVTYELWPPDAPHPDTVDRFIDKALKEDCWRWIPVPLTYVPYGDFGEELAVSGSDLVDGSTTAWAGTNATPSFVSQVPPNEYVRRVVRVTSSATGGYLQSQGMDVDPDNREGWAIHALTRAVGSGGAGSDARIVIRDVTNSADITPDETLTWTRRGWGLLKSSFTLPDDCNQIAIRLVAQTNGEASDWAWVQAWPKGQNRFSLPQRITSENHVGQVFVRVGDTFDEFQRSPWYGNMSTREAGGTGVQLQLDPGAEDLPLWFYEKDAFPTLTSATPAAADDDNTTWAEEIWVRAAATWELYRSLSRRDRKGELGWGRFEVEARDLLLAMQKEYGAQPVVIEDAATPAYQAVAQPH